MKKILNKNFLRTFLGTVVLVFLFILASVFADKYQTEMQALASGDGALGMGAYVVLTLFAVVVAPVSTLPLLPLASVMWGWVMAGILSVAGWTIGGQIAFLLARRYGKPLRLTAILLLLY
jgi:uncharacterized membrane protein YdjX (TVP38/TMEM64 family)